MLFFHFQSSTPMIIMGVMPLIFSHALRKKFFFLCLMCTVEKLFFSIFIIKVASGIYSIFFQLLFLPSIPFLTDKLEMLLLHWSHWREKWERVGLSYYLKLTYLVLTWLNKPLFSIWLDYQMGLKIQIVYTYFSHIKFLRQFYSIMIKRWY